MRIAKPLLFVCMSGFATAALAQGYYEYIPYYNNNPFLFCTLGVPQDCWAPVDPATGTYVVTDEYCFNPVSAAQYARVCPHAFETSGSGAGSQGMGGSMSASMGPSGKGNGGVQGSGSSAGGSGGSTH